MIRRDIRLTDGSAGWALISQIEHARISAQLAELCLPRFSDAASQSVRDEALAAIRRHDDGWAEWEQSPRLHDQPRRPVSFMELEPAEGTEIWSRSIDRSALHGPLAGWMVAGHFCRLLDIHSIAADRDAATHQWYDDMQRRREQWLAEWQAAAPSHRTPQLAAEALQWLWTFDELSLWFCCTCPSRSQSAVKDTRPYVVGRGTPIEMELSFADDQAVAIPWRFDAPSIEIGAQCQIVAAAPYPNAASMLAAATSHQLQWRLAASPSQA